MNVSFGETEQVLTEAAEDAITTVNELVNEIRTGAHESYDTLATDVSKLDLPYPTAFSPKCKGSVPNLSIRFFSQMVKLYQTL